MKIQERERLCLGLLKRLPQRFILVGGYAASSFDFPRFSVDLDLVVRESDVKEILEILQKEGFKAVKNVGDFSDSYKGRIIRWERKVGSLPVSVDLFVDMIQARQTNVGYSFAYLWKNSERRRVVGSGVKDYVEVTVADREMLIALKINSMRTTDQRDIIALCNGVADVAKIVRHLKRAPKDQILNHLDVISATLERRESKDSIKGVFGISDDVYKKVIDKAKREIHSIREDIFREEDTT